MKGILLVALAPLLTAQEPLSPGVMELGQRAAGLQQAGDYAAAAEVYRGILRVAPNDVATHVNLGVVLARLNRFDEALEQYRAADRLLPGDPRIRLNMGLAYQKSGRLRDAVAELEKVHSQAPENRQAMLLLADAYLQLGDNQRVMDLLRPAAGAAADDLAIAYLLGMAELRAGQIEEGQAMLDRILGGGETAEAHYLLGTRMFESRDYPGAVKELAAAVRLNAKLPQLESLYGRALLNTGDADGAQQAFRAALQQQPEDVDAKVSLGAILAARHQCGEAEPLLRGGLAARPQSGEAQLGLAQCLDEQKEFRQALPHAEQAARLLPQSPEAHQLLGAAYSGLHQEKAAARERVAAQQLRAKWEEPPHAGEPAPDFTLPPAASGAPVRLGAFRGKSPVVLVFGSYSCPNFRSAAGALRAAYDRFHADAVFLLVYIREAHTQEEWESTRNERQAIRVHEAATMNERQQNALACSRRLRLPFTAVADTLDGKVETAYHAWPARAFILDKQGRIVYSTRLSELDFRAPEFERSLAAVAR